MSVIKRPVRASQERPDWILDATGRAICVVCYGSREEDRTVAAEIVEALNGYEIVQQAGVCCCQSNGTTTLTPEP